MIPVRIEAVDRAALSLQNHGSPFDVSMHVCA